VTGGRPQILYPGVLLSGIALDDDQLYWVSTTPFAGRAAIYRGPAAGGTATALSFADANGSIAVDAQYAYWTASGGVFRVPKGGGATEQVINCGSRTPFKVVVDADTIYYRDLDGDVWAGAKAGGDVRRLNTGNPSSKTGGYLLDLAVQSKIAYWTSIDHTASTLPGLFSANADGTGWTALDSGTDLDWYGPRVDDTSIFYFHAGALYRRLK
jgi:hypothetical protein